MRLKWLGHACFLITSANHKIVTDPYDTTIGYKFPQVEADIVTVSHQHRDHGAVEMVAGKPQVVFGAERYEFDGLEIVGIKSFHDKKQGRERGTNIIYKYWAEGIIVCHLGDLGHIPDDSLVDEIGEVHVLLLPVGGTYTITADEAVTVKNRLKPKVTTPMHFKTPDLNFKLAPLEDFTRHFDSVVKIPTLEVTPAQLDSLPEIVVLDYTCN